MSKQAELITAWVSRHFDYKRRVGQNGPELVIANPFYGNNKKKFNISLNEAMCHDWRGDNWAGPISIKTGKRDCSFINFVARYRNCTRREAAREVYGSLEYLAGHRAKTESQNAREAKENTVIELPKGSRPISAHDDVHTNILRKWLYGRGYTEEAIRNDNLHYLGLDVIWPYYEFDELVYWQSRSRYNKIYRFPPAEESQISKSDVLYGFDDTDLSSYIILTEAIFDQHTLGEQALATGGITVSAGQISKIHLLNPIKGIILSPDDDKAGIQSILINQKILLKTGHNLYYSLPGIAKDWNELITGHKLTASEARKIHDENIRPLDTKNIVALRKKLKELGVYQ